jgi:hypothetical protein
MLERFSVAGITRGILVVVLRFCTVSDFVVILVVVIRVSVSGPVARGVFGISGILAGRLPV